MTTPVCNRDCFNCPFPDCINDELTHADYVAARELEKFIRPPTPAEIKVAAAQKAYREANREKVAAAQKAYREANREKVAAAKKAYYEANREKVAAAQFGRLLFDLRTEHGMTQAALGKFLGGVSQPTISLWETGAVPFDLDAIRARFEGVAEHA